MNRPAPSHTMKAEPRSWCGLTQYTRPQEELDAILAANAAAAHKGQRRSNADKRRCVEIAVKEFAGLSSRAIAELCAVSDFMVNQQRGALQESSNATRTTSDGRQYPATRRSSKPTTPEEEEAMSAVSKAIRRLRSRRLVESTQTGAIKITELGKAASGLLKLSLTPCKPFGPEPTQEGIV